MVLEISVDDEKGQTIKGNLRLLASDGLLAGSRRLSEQLLLCKVGASLPQIRHFLRRYVRFLNHVPIGRQLGGNELLS